MEKKKQRVRPHFKHNAVELLQNLPPHLKLYADRYISKKPTDSEYSDSLYVCDRHSKPDHHTSQNIGGMRKGFLSSQNSNIVRDTVPVGSVKSASIKPTNLSSPSLSHDINPPTTASNSMVNTAATNGTLLIQSIEVLEKLNECVKIYGVKATIAHVIKLMNGELIQLDILIKESPFPLSVSTGRHSYNFFELTALYRGNYIDFFFEGLISDFDHTKDYRGFVDVLSGFQSPISTTTEDEIYLQKTMSAAGIPFDKMQARRAAYTRKVIELQLIFSIFTCMNKGKWKLKTRLDEVYKPFTIDEDHLALSTTFNLQELKKRMSEVNSLLSQAMLILDH